MERLLFVVLAVVVAGAGCLGAPGATTDGESVSVEYVVRSDSVPDTVSNVYVDFAVYFSEYPDDVYSCTDGAPLLDNKYDPTPTPLPTVAGQCKQFDVPRVDLAALDGPKSLGEFPASGTYSGSHTLVVHDVTVVLDDGTTATDVHDTDFRAVTEQSTPAGTHGVEFAVTDYRNSDDGPGWRFGIEHEPFDPTAD